MNRNTKLTPMENYFSNTWVNTRQDLTSRRFIKGEFLFRKNDPTLGVYLIQQGFIKVRGHVNGDMVCITSLHKAGDFVGLHYILDGKSQFSSDAVCMSNTEAIFINGNDFLSFLSANYNVYMEVLKKLCLELETMESRINALTSRNVRQRLAGECLNLQKFFSSDENCSLNISIDLSELSELIHASLSTTEKLLRELIQHDIISYTNGFLKILQADKLYCVANLSS